MTDTGPGATFKAGDLLNNTYRIESILGRGGTSEVYQARSEISGNRVALKVLRAEFSRNEDFLNLMKREEEIREIRHDAIVRYYHNQRSDLGDVFLVMDFVDGPGLDKKLKQGGMSADDLMIVAERVVEGLKAAHAKLIVHRDLSPDNIILRNGDPADAVIIDFGIAKDSNPGAETIVGNEFAGKYAYAAPEQLSGQSDARSDIYALGALLLATFRGQPPNVGNNPMEVIEKKKLALDTSGVPEPLRTLINRMTTPDPALRPQDAGAVLDLIRGVEVGADVEEATVIAPRSRQVPDAPPPPLSGGQASPEKSGSRRGVLVAVLGVVVAAGAGAAAYFSGVLSPSLPIADPYVLTLEQPLNGPARAAGHVPSEATAQAISQQLDALGGTSQVTLARGEISSEWGPGIVGLLDAVQDLPEWRVDVAGNAVRIEGLTENRAVFDRIGATLDQTAAAAGLQLETMIDLGPRLLPASTLDPILKTYADCGNLLLLNPPPMGFGQDDPVIVAGRLSTAEAKSDLTAALRNVAGMRDVDVAAQVLNPTLCLFDSVLPAAPSGGFEIQFARGETETPVPSGDFTVGQNPVIDLVIPADVTNGYLFASALDVSGNVFHLMPNVNRQENSVAALRNGRTGPITIRLAHTLDEAAASEGKKLAFIVDDAALGQTQILVLRSSEEFLDGMRPTTESAIGYAEALAASRGTITSLDTRILTTALP